MPASFSTQVLGAKEAVRSLNKIEPGLRKQFARDATRIAQPAISEAQQRYQSIGWGATKVRGLSRNWSQAGRPLLPYNPAKASRGVKIKVEGDRRKTAVILIEQRDAGTAILESAGRKTTNGLGTALGFIKPTTTRVLGPALYSKKKQVTSEMEKAMLEVVRRVQKELN
jgi:hypothetical protein